MKHLVVQKKSQKSFLYLLLSIIAMLLAIGAIIFSVFIWQQWNRYENETNEQMQQLQQSITQQKNAQSERWEQIQSVLQAAAHPGQQPVSDIGALIRAANISLIIDDVPRALELLKMAQQALITSHSTNDALNRALTQDIAQLSAAPVVSITELLSQIDALIQEINHFTIYTQSSSPKLSTAQQSKPSNPILEHLSRVFIIRHWDAPATSILQPESFDFLKQNVQIKLYQAEWALLNRDSQIYQASLQAVIQQLTPYQTRQPEVGPWIQKIQNLLSVDIKPKQFILQSLSLVSEPGKTQS